MNKTGFDPAPNMDSVFDKSTDAEIDFDVMYDREDQFIDIVAGYNEAGDPLTGVDFETLHQDSYNDTVKSFKDELETPGDAQGATGWEGSKSLESNTVAQGTNKDGNSESKRWIGTPDKDYQNGGKSWTNPSVADTVTGTINKAGVNGISEGENCAGGDCDDSDDEDVKEASLFGEGFSIDELLDEEEDPTQGDFSVEGEDDKATMDNIEQEAYFAEVDDTATPEKTEDSEPDNQTSNNKTEEDKDVKESFDFDDAMLEAELMMLEADDEKDDQKEDSKSNQNNNNSNNSSNNNNNKDGGEGGVETESYFDDLDLAMMEMGIYDEEGELIDPDKNPNIDTEAREGKQCSCGKASCPICGRIKQDIYGYGGNNANNPVDPDKKVTGFGYTNPIKKDYLVDGENRNATVSDISTESFDFDDAMLEAELMMEADADVKDAAADDQKEDEQDINYVDKGSNGGSNLGYGYEDDELIDQVMGESLFDLDY